MKPHLDYVVRCSLRDYRQVHPSKEGDGVLGGYVCGREEKRSCEAENVETLHGCSISEVSRRVTIA